ncbi:MAG: prepilin-type N-terminal cleavage/methylation domain-containing protein [Opitutaceae bacterium]
MKKSAPRLTSRRGFTLIEVMMAAFVMVVMFLSALSALQQGFKLLDTARNTTLAGQIIQSEMEDLRLKSWTMMPASGPIDLATSIAEGLSSTERAALASRFTATRTITGVTGRESDFRRVVIDVAWNDASGRRHNRAYETLIGRNGLSDYFVTTHASGSSTP